jgi:hypothetical protein
MKIQAPFSILFFLFLFGVALLGTSSCKAVEKAVERGIRQGRTTLQEESDSLQILTADITEAAIRSAMTTLADDQLQGAIRADLQVLLDSILQQFGDSLHVTSEELITDLLGTQTDSLLNQRLGTIATALLASYAELEPEIRQSLQQILTEDLNGGLAGILNNLLGQLNTPETYATIEALRMELARQVDSLLLSSLGATARYTDVLIVPQVEDLADRVEVISTDTEQKASNLIWKIVAGGAALLFIAGMIRLYLQQRKYREMVKVFTANIDTIEQQTTYDKLVMRISEEMKKRDLEPSLREILEEQDLIEQPEWEDKDHQVMQLLISQLKESAESEAVDRETWTNALFEKAKSLDLENHLKSMIKRK